MASSFSRIASEGPVDDKLKFMFIEVHPLKGIDAMFLNVRDIEAVYEFGEKDSAHAFVRLHERDSLELRETYAEVKGLIEQADLKAVRYAL